ncbi:MAG TPA: hypothetical protein VJM12_01080 [Pyrinomonadaceae bacterium]|nr:hypothetical protein [Pyrinomonadaceae bacterium]
MVKQHASDASAGRLVRPTNAAQLPMSDKLQFVVDSLKKPQFDVNDKLKLVGHQTAGATLAAPAVSDPNLEFRVLRS